MRQKSIKVNAILNIIRQSLSIVFPMITYPYVSRLLGADNLGRYSFSDSIVQIVITLSLIGIPTYAVREGAMVRNDERKICDFCSEVFTINCISALLSYAALLIMILFVKRIRVECVLVCILSVNVMSKCLGRDWLNSIYEDYLYISLRVIAVHLVSLILIFLLVRDRDDLVKYVIIMASAELFGNVLNFCYTRKKIPYRLTFSRKLLMHLKPILILFCSSIATTVYIRSDIAIIGFLRPNSDVGVYTVSSKIYLIVKNMLNAVITVAIPRLSLYLGSFDAAGRERYNVLLNRLRNVLILLLFPAAVGLFCLSGDTMCLVGGAEFQSGDASLQILCVAMMFAVFGCFFAHAVLIVNRRETVFFKATVISALVNILLNFVLIPHMGINGAAFTTALSELCIVAICGWSARKYYTSDQTGLLRYLVQTVAECVLICIVSWIMTLIFPRRMPRVLGTVGISLAAYAVILAVTKNDLWMDVLHRLKNIRDDGRDYHETN